jgi:hypothetical protein
MKRPLSILAIVLVTGSLFAQNPTQPQPNDVTTIAVHMLNPPIAPGGVTIGFTGAPGSSAKTVYYWLVSNFTVGNSTVGGPYPGFNAPTTLTSSNFFTAYWQPVLGATSYDLLRTSTPNPPTGACNCAVATGISALFKTDQSNSLSSYTVSTFDPNSALLQLSAEATGVGASAVHLLLKQGGSLVADLSTGGGGGGAVASVFGRTGTVTALGADYSAFYAQLNPGTDQTISGSHHFTISNSGTSTPQALVTFMGNGTGTLFGQPGLLDLAPENESTWALTIRNKSASPANGLTAYTDNIGQSFIQNAAPDGTVVNSIIMRPGGFIRIGSGTCAGLAVDPSGNVLVGATCGANLALDQTGGLTFPSSVLNNSTLKVLASNIRNVATVQFPNLATSDLAVQSFFFQLSAGLPFASLPACAGGTEGMVEGVSNSNTTTLGATIAGGGSSHVLGYCNGSNWIMAAAAGAGSDATTLLGSTWASPGNIGTGTPSSGAFTSLNAVSLNNTVYSNRLPGATVDVRFNECTLAVAYNGGGRCDASAESGAQTINSELEGGGEYPAPTATAVAGAAFSAGAYRVITAYATPGGNAVMSQEATVTTSGGNLGIQVTSPPSVYDYTGTLRAGIQYNVYITAISGATWTELLCPGGPYNVGSSTTINAACSGAAVPTKPNAVDVVLPAQAVWTGAITDGTSCLLKVFHESHIAGLNAGLGGPMEIANGASGNVRSVACTDPNPPPAIGSGSTMIIEGFQAGNRSGGTVAQAALEITHVFDTMTVRNMSVANYNGKSLYVHNSVCCGVGIEHSTFNGNSSAGAIPCVIGATNESTSAVSLSYDTCVHPGTGNPAVQINNPSWTTNISFYSLYMESFNPGGACGGGDVSLVQLLNGGGNAAGGYLFDAPKLGSACSGPAATSYIFSIDPNVKSVTITNGNTGGWTRGIIDNNASPARTIANNLGTNSIIPPYQTSNGSLTPISLGGLFDTANRTAALSATTICATTACGPGDYLVSLSVEQTGSACADATAGSLDAITMTFTDDSGAESVVVPLTGVNVQTPASLGAWLHGTGGANGMPFCGTSGACAALPNAANGKLLIHSTGAQPIQAATSYTACTTGTGSYRLKIFNQQIQ